MVKYVDETKLANFPHKFIPKSSTLELLLIGEFDSEVHA